MLTIAKMGEKILMNSFSEVVFMNCFNDEEWKKKHGVIPVLSKDGKTITYGLYPQTVVSDSALIEKLNQLTAPESNGWYFYNGDFYVKLVATSKHYGVPSQSQSDYYKFNNEANIIAGKIYWFKVEPITWNIMNAYENGECLVISSVLLDAHCYDSESNNYKESDIRAWLNNDFYYSAFALGNIYIQRATVDNSAASTGESPNPHTCEDTEDKVFLPSYKEYYGAIQYGTLLDSPVKFESTDYARANGVSHSDNAFDYNNDGHWTRSPSSRAGDFAEFAYAGGIKFGQAYVKEDNIGVCPCIIIKTSEHLNMPKEMKKAQNPKYVKFLNDEVRKKKLGVIPVLSKDGKTITYGLYPQKVVSDPTTIEALNKLTTPESNGWYLYNDEYYAKLEAKPNDNYDVDYPIFNNKATIEEGETYWFKCEAIKWKVLSNKNGEYFILSSVLLDAHCYDASYSYCDYEDSDIRAWLNDEFYNSAFALNNTYIKTTTVDNSAATTYTRRPSIPGPWDQTEDKVFLPSYQDYTNDKYGFDSLVYRDKTRECKTTDYARANGAGYNPDSPYTYNGTYWTRSQYCSRSTVKHFSSDPWHVNSDGSLWGGGDYCKILAVRPCLIIKIV